MDLPQASWPTSELLPLCRRPSHGPGPRAAGAGSAHCRPVAPPSADSPPPSPGTSAGLPSSQGCPAPNQSHLFPQRPGPEFPKAKSQLGDTPVPGTLPQSTSDSLFPPAHLRGQGATSKKGNRGQSHPHAVTSPGGCAAPRRPATPRDQTSAQPEATPRPPGSGRREAGDRAAGRRL